jgi:glycosyltransferase involved in cell wall biosynthesis
MRFLLLADIYVPSRISAALQLRDLAQELARQGHEVVVLVPCQGLGRAWRLEQVDGVSVLRVRAPRTKDIGLVRRAIGEALLPLALLLGLWLGPLRRLRWDGIIWYSPTIFLGPAVAWLKRASRCRAYLILRDLFPDWAVDAGVLRKGLTYRVFKAVERFQYRQADVIGVQTPANAPLVATDAPRGTRIEVLYNWLAAPAAPDTGPLPDGLGHWMGGRTVFVYAGNIGVAQDLDAFLDIAPRFAQRHDLGFLIVGRGSERERLRDRTTRAALGNVMVADEVSPDVLQLVLARCHVGLIALHPGHATHNIPGKLLTYLHARLPVLARVNANNDLVGFLEQEQAGLVVPGDQPDLLVAHVEQLLDEPGLRADMGARGAALAERLFSPDGAVRQILAGLG